MKINLQNFIDGLIMYDYILFSGVLLLFVLFIILAILLRKKTFLAIFLVLFAFATFLLGPTVGYLAMHKFLFKNHTELLSYKKLHFTPAVVVEAKITNQSKFDFKSCKITASAYKVTSNKYKNYIYKFKPFKKMSIFEEGIKKGQTREFKIIVEPFTYEKDFNISLGADCK
jgi:hypothetical protein